MVATAALGGTALFSPAAVLGSLQAGTTIGFQDIAFVRMTGAAAVVGGILDYCLQYATARRLLGTSVVQATYQLLMVAGGIRYVGYIAAVAATAASGDLAPSPGLWALLLLALAGAAVYSATYAATSASGAPAFRPILQQDSAGSAAVSAAYCALGAGYLVKAAGAWQPDMLLAADVAGAQHFLGATWSGSFLAAAIVCHVLASSERDGRLGTELCKTLNLGLVGLELTSRSALTGLAIQGGFDDPAAGYGLVAYSVASAAFFALQYITGRLR